MSGYSGKPLVSKLGIKAGTQLCPVTAPENYLDLIRPLPEEVVIVADVTLETDIVHIFAYESAKLSEALSYYRKNLKSSAAIWVSWPKKASKVATDITEDTVRDLALPLGFVDIKVCAVTEVWSGLKLVVRKELR